MKKLLIILLFSGIAAAMTFYILYNKPHRDPANETSIQISAEELFTAFNEDETNANTLYLDKVLEVKGKILEVTTNQDQMTVVVLETNDPIFGIRCSMSKSTDVSVSDFIIVQGICTGYLSDVIITNAFLKQKTKEDE
jgi:hypothetical protein